MEQNWKWARLHLKMDGPSVKDGCVIDALKPKSLIARKARPIVETALSDTRVVASQGSE
jgi:hypothetical protein